MKVVLLKAPTTGSPTQGGILQYISGVPSGGGTVFSNVPAGKIWKLQSLIFTVATDATLATRQPLFTIFSQSPGASTYELNWDFTMGPSSTVRYSAALNGPVSKIAEHPITSLTAVPLQAGDSTFVTLLGAIGADAISGAILTVLEFDA